MAAVVELSRVKKSFEGRPAVKEISFKIEKGETVGLLGPNGAGKTTLIHMLLGLITATEGEIRLFGMKMPEERQPILARAAFSSAYVQMPLSLTPRQNLDVFSRLYGRKGNGRIDELLERFGIADHADRATRALSSGQLSRLNLCKALLHDPELLLLDEPTASMDPDMADKTREILKGIQKERGMTVLYTSHNMREVETLATRVLFMRKGELVAEGSPKELVARFGQADLEDVFLKLVREGGAK